MRNLFIVVMMFSASLITAQTNPSSIDLKIIKGQPFTLSLIGLDVVAVVPTTIREREVGNPDKGTHDITFLADEAGSFSTVYKYSESGDTYYTTINITSLESLISLEHDYQEINQGETAIIDVLGNDESSAGELDVTSIPYVQNGSASIIGGFIEFIPDSDFRGLAYLNYVVTDEMGESETGFATINVRDSEGVENSEIILDKYFVQAGEALDVVIPSELSREDFGSSQLGKLKTLGTGVLRYSAGEKTGVDNISYNNEGNDSSFEVYVFGKSENHGFIRDDVIYTSMGESVQFDVFANDLEKSFIIIDKSPELKLVSPGSGQMVYSPPQGFQGTKNFYYKVSDGNQTYIGNIEVIVNDDLPQTRVYAFVTRENTPFLIQHSSITDGVINFVQAPVNGVLRIQENGFFYCAGQVNGQGFMVYEPNDGFVGQDEFEVEYCSQSGVCVTLEIVMEVEASSSDCNCIGEDCVWPGDTDGDGVVSVKDILPIGYHMGESGSARAEQGGDWNALVADDWGDELESGGHDIKNVDANGDGEVNKEDVDVLNDNYLQLNSFISSEALSVKDVPFYAVPREKSGTGGDLILIDLFVGSESYPLIESNGLAFNFSIPPSYIEDNSLQFTFTPSDWFGYNNPTISTVQYPTVGRVEAGISRTGGEANDGFGVIGTFQIVLQEDQDGFKPEDDQLPIEIEINGGQYLNNAGEKFGLESSKTTIYLDLAEENVVHELEVITFPNPVNQILTIHANNQDKIQNVIVYNALGQSVSEHINVGSNHFELNTSQYPEGMYLARVETLLGVSVEKIQVVRE